MPASLRSLVGGWTDPHEEIGSIIREVVPLAIAWSLKRHVIEELLMEKDLMSGCAARIETSLFRRGFRSKGVSPFLGISKSDIWRA